MSDPEETDFMELTSNLIQTAFGEGAFGSGGFSTSGTISLDDEINAQTTWTEVDE